MDDPDILTKNFDNFVLNISDSCLSVRVERRGEASYKYCQSKCQYKLKALFSEGSALVSVTQSVDTMYDCAMTRPIMRLVGRNVSYNFGPYFTL